VNNSSKAEKISFIPPFLILVLEIILLVHALTAKNLPDNLIVIELTTILLIISLVEILLVGREIHEHYLCDTFDRVLTIKLDDFVFKTKEKNVKRIVEAFIASFPQYRNYRHKIYHITCQIMQTHQEEAFEEELTKHLETFLKQKKKLHVDDIVELFVENYPKYKQHRSEIYEKTCQFLANSKTK
jgi:hypothetical protein